MTSTMFTPADSEPNRKVILKICIEARRAKPADPVSEYNQDCRDALAKACISYTVQELTLAQVRAMHIVKTGQVGAE